AHGASRAPTCGAGRTDERPGGTLAKRRRHRPSVALDPVSGIFGECGAPFAASSPILGTMDLGNGRGRLSWLGTLVRGFRAAPTPGRARLPHTSAGRGFRFHGRFFRAAGALS